MLGRGLLVTIALALLAAGCSSGGPTNTTAPSAVAANPSSTVYRTPAQWADSIGRTICTAYPAVNSDGSATCDGNISIAVFDTPSERNTWLTKALKNGAVTPNTGVVEGKTWVVICPPADVVRIGSETGGTIIQRG